MATDDLNWSCTEKCRSLQHGDTICAIATKGDDKEVVNMWESTCRNYGIIKDVFGRSAFHMAASTKNTKAVDWLLKKDKSLLNAKDLISGYTPLHRSIYFGQIQIARNLIAAGASMTTVDNEGLNPIDLYLIDRLSNLPVTKEFKLESDPTELYIWGTNDNFNLGTDNQSARKIPEPLDRFRPRRTTNSCVSHVNLQNFHSVFLGQSGEVFSCGIGHYSGRLGLGEKETVALVPHRIPLKDRCIQIAAGTDHIIFLMHDGIVKSCGSNENFVLGHQTDPLPEKIFLPKTIDTLRPITITRVRASSTHSVFCRLNRIYTCGINDGQLGHFGNPESPVIAPRLVTCIGVSVDQKDNTDTHFTHVECNDFATVIRNQKGFIYILYRNECRRIAAQQFAVMKIVVVGGQSFSLTTSEQVGNSPLCLFLLTKTGSLIIWREDMNAKYPRASSATSMTSGFSGSAIGGFTHVVFDLSRTLSLKDIVVSRNSIVVVTSGGEGFIGRWNNSTKPIISSNRNSPEEVEKRLMKLALNKSCDIESEGSSSVKTAWIQVLGKGNTENVILPLEHVKMKRLLNIHAGEAVTCDPKGNNFAIIQRYHKLDFVELPISLPSTMSADWERLYEEVHLEDILHDVVFHVENSMTPNSRRSFPAHRFIIATICPQLFYLIKEAYVKTSRELPVIVSIPNTEPFVFEQLIKFIYTGTCDLFNIGTRLPILNNLVDPNTLVRLVVTYARQMKLDTLSKKLNHVQIIDGIVELKKEFRLNKNQGIVREPRKTSGRKAHGDLTDVTIVSSDNLLIPAHRCILVARMDYFNRMMFTGTWRESTTRKISLSVKKSTIEVILDFLYEERTSKLTELDVESIREVFMASDLFVLNELRAYVEVALAETIHHKNVAELLNQAILYNATQLRDSCYNFICLNLAQLLENRLLDNIDDDVMSQVGQYYRNYHPIMRHRQLRIDSCAPTDDVYSAALTSPCLEFENFIQSYEDFEEEEFEIKTTKTVKTKPKRVRNRTRTLSSECDVDSSIIKLSPSVPIPLLPRQQEIPPGISPKSSPQQQQQQQQQQQPMKERNVRPIQIPEKSKNILSSLHFPSLSPLIPQSDHFQLLSQSPPSKSSNIISSGKKKTKWRSLTNENLEKQQQILKNDSIQPPLIVPSNVVHGRDPTNPWQKFKSLPDVPSTSFSSTTTPKTTKVEVSTKGVGFKEIIQEEQEMKDNFIKAIEKPLRLMQIEELAIQQLMAKYKNEDTTDGTEILTIERVCSAKYANPTWPHSTNKMTPTPSFRKSQ